MRWQLEAREVAYGAQRAVEVSGKVEDMEARSVREQRATAERLGKGLKRVADPRKPYG